MAKSLIIDRTELGLDPLDVNDPENGYEVIGETSFGGRVKDRQMAPAVPWVNYERVLHVRLTNSTYAFTVAVTGATPAVRKAREQALLDAIDQVEFMVTDSVDGDTVSYICMSADATCGENGERSETWLPAGVQVWNISGPHRGPAE